MLPNSLNHCGVHAESSLPDSPTGKRFTLYTAAYSFQPQRNLDLRLQIFAGPQIAKQTRDGTNHHLGVDGTAFLFNNRRRSTYF